MIRFEIITIFPNIFKGFLEESLIARGQKKKIIKINLHNLRNWTNDKHKTVDDRPFGGGPGMVLKVEPILKTVKSLKTKDKKKKKRVILFSPRGKKFTQNDARRLSKYDQLIFICGRYEGTDERVADFIADEIISIGSYVLNGGEVATMVLIEAIARLVPGFIAKAESTRKVDHAQYTRPESIEITGKKRRVPKVLLSGNHRKISEWRKANK